MASSPSRSARSAGRPIPFHTTKYGPELLVDVAWVHEMDRFIVDRPHALAFHDIALITRGRGTLAIDGVRHRIGPGTIAFSGPGQIRDWAAKDLDAICLFFPALFLHDFFTDTRFLERLGYFGPDRASAVIHLGARTARALQRQLERMRSELRRLRSDSVHLLRARAYEILITLNRQYLERASGTAAHSLESRTQRLIQLVERHHAREQRVAWYAHELAMTPGYLNTLCRRHLGVNAKRVVADRILLEARRQLLYSEKSIDQVGTALGFKDPSYFTRFFRARTGKTPSEFRKG